MQAERKPDRRIALFLGAGFSHDAGFPLVANFGTHKAVKNDRDGLLGHAQAKRDSPQYRLAAPMLVEAAETFYGFQALCRASHTVSADDANNLETVFCIAEALNEAGFSHVPLDGQPCSLRYVIRNIQLWLWKVYQQMPLLNPRPRDRVRPESYERLFGVMGQLGIGGDLAVITTNYDLVFEYLAWKNGFRCYYPFSDAVSIQAGFEAKPYICINKPHESFHLSAGGNPLLPANFNAVRFYVNEHSGRIESDDPPPFAVSPVVAKLHGSVNFYLNPEAEDPEALYVSDDLACSGDQIGRSNVPTERPAIFAVDAIWSIQTRYGDSFTPAIIPPTYAKLTGTKWLRTLWSQTVVWLGHAEKLVFVGYSLPESDGFVRAMINGAMLQRESDPKVYVINPSEEDHCKFRKLFGDWYVDIGLLHLHDVSEAQWRDILSVE